MKSDSFTFQVKFWSLVGPFFCSLNFCLFYIKGFVFPYYLPAILPLGLLLCWRWTLKGFFAAALVFFLILAWHYSDIPLEERFWHIGAALSSAASLFITALGFEEVQALAEAMQLESKSRLENLWKVDEKFQQAEAELKKKKERIRELQLKISSFQKVLDRTKDQEF